MKANRFKYPRTMHMPWSPGVQSDDKVIKTTDQFNGRRVILTEKMDGENTTMYRDGIHARSIDSAHHPSRDWVKRIWAENAWMIPDGDRICGENMYAQHSVVYEELESYFYVFSVWHGTKCYDWDYTVSVGRLGMPHVKVLYDGIYDEKVIRDICESLDTSRIEGAVLRIADEILYEEFDKYVMKYVRKGHVQTDEHWMHQAIKPNGIRLDLQKKFG
ncbi:2'-5' RNA ligase [Xanthomonas phage XacN1]|nr:2'-5' RNA ligase [Xanthomonas phage XacN1]